MGLVQSTQIHLCILPCPFASQLAKGQGRMERDDTQAVGPDIGVVLYMTVAILVVAWQLRNTRKILSA
jgi:hypothetical protein